MKAKGRAKRGSALLDDLSALARADRSGMLGLTARYPEQCKEGMRLGRAVALPRGPKRPDCVVLAGMGGSAAGGELLRVLAGPDLGCGFYVHRDYSLPSFVGPGSLVLVASYSGDTEEALSAYREARRRGAARIAICSGGALARMARRDGAPMCLVPGGQPPRTASGYLFFPMWVVLCRLGLVRSQARAEGETLALLERMAGRLGPEAPCGRNAAKQLALGCVGKVPVVYGWNGFVYAVALRWKTQFNENAKVPAFAYPVPEMNHNEIMGWEGPTELTGRFLAIWLRDRREPKRIAERFEYTKEVLQGRLTSIEQWSEGASAMARAFSLWYLGDWVSIYLALARGTDPTPIAGIVSLKRALAGR